LGLGVRKPRTPKVIRKDVRSKPRSAARMDEFARQRWVANHLRRFAKVHEEVHKEIAAQRARDLRELERRMQQAAAAREKRNREERKLSELRAKVDQKPDGAGADYQGLTRAQREVRKLRQRAEVAGRVVAPSSGPNSDDIVHDSEYVRRGFIRFNNEWGKWVGKGRNAKWVATKLELKDIEKK
jgi:hypothetical protein